MSWTVCPFWYFHQIWTLWSLLTLRLIAQHVAKAAVCVDVTLLWERIQLLRWAGWLTLGKVREPVSPSLNKEVELDAGKRPIWEIKYQGATWPLTLHVVGYFRKVLVSIQILVFAGDRNPARLSWGRKTNLSQGKGLSNSRNNPSQGFKPFPDTLPPSCPWLLSSVSSVLSNLLLWWAQRNLQNLWEVFWARGDRKNTRLNSSHAT